jgi:hypothetical protein
MDPPFFVYCLDCQIGSCMNKREIKQIRMNGSYNNSNNNNKNGDDRHLVKKKKVLFCACVIFSIHMK